MKLRRVAPPPLPPPLTPLEASQMPMAARACLRPQVRTKQYSGQLSFMHEASGGQGVHHP